MTADALILHFDGEPDDLARLFRAASARYAEAKDAAPPDTASLLRHPGGITVVLVWPADETYRHFRRFLYSVVGEHRLPHPRVEHLDVDANTWAAIVGPS